MNFFDVIPSELFSPLASPNRALYADALDVLYNAYRENLKISEDVLYSMLRSELEQLAQRQEEKLSALQEIGKLYRDMNQSIDRRKIQSFLVQWARKEMLQGQIESKEREKQDCIDNLAATARAIEDLAAQIEQKESRRRELDLACAQSGVFQEEERLRSQKQLLLDEQNRLMQELHALAIEIRRDAVWWTELCGVIPKREQIKSLR